MAILKLTIGKIDVATEQRTSSVRFVSKDGVERNYILSLQDVKLMKKMYQPAEIIAILQIHMGADNGFMPVNIPRSTAWKPVAKNRIMDAFFHQRVKVSAVNDNSSEDIIGNDFFVHEVIPTYKPSSLFVELRIYSLDKLLTLSNYCSSWTAKKLAGHILASLLPNYRLPYDANNHLECDTSQMKHLVKDGLEHIFPYLVQYNESFYDMLARTCNRWGEFLYWEDGKLRIGYDADEKKAKEVSDYSSVTFHDNTSTQPISAKSTYSTEAPYDNNVLNSTVKKDGAAIVFGTIKNLASMKTGADYYWLSKVGQVLTNNKSIMNFLFDMAVNDLIMWAQQEALVSQYNHKHNDDYFNKKKKYISTLDEQYDNSKKTLNQFSENEPFLNAEAYAEILVGEMLAEQNTVEIDFDTTWPGLKLGDIIDVESEKFIVVEISARINEENHLLFRVIGVAKNGGKFYPMMIPSGHVRQSGPQVAVVVDVEDPNKKNRVRLKYPWQLTSLKPTYEEITAKDIKNNDISDATPWLIYAASSGPAEAGVHGRHYLAEKVLVNYANNNVERPFVVGAVSTATPRALKTSSAVIQAPNGEYIKVHEGSGKGATAFMANFTPGLSLVNGFLDFPDLFGEDNEMSKAFEGGVVMGDKYGIWKISGSTDRRAIDINSPWGNVSINAFTGITVNAPNGNINIRGKNVSIEAGNNLTLKSGTNIRNKFASSYGGDARFNITSFMYDVTVMVAKKLASLVESVFDLALIRSLIEVYWKPQEGALTIQSNRYLMLGAGGALPGYPDQAYLKPKVFEEREKKLTDAILPKPIKAMLEVLNNVPNLVGKMAFNYKERYQTCINKKEEFEKAIQYLLDFSDSNDPSEVCKQYEGLKDKFWDTETKEIMEADMGFTDRCNTNNKDDIGQICLNKFPAVLPLDRTDTTAMNIAKEFLLMSRSEAKAEVIKKANELLKSIAELRSEPQKWGDLMKYGIGPRKSFGSDEYFNSLKTVFSASTLRDTSFFKYAYDEHNKITDVRANLTKNTKFKWRPLAFVRFLFLNLVESWGMKPTPVKNELFGAEYIPIKPVTDDDLENDAKWNLYVRSLQFTASPANAGTLLDELADVFDPSQFKLSTSFKEYYAWGNSKAGRILFGTGSTYCMNDDGTISKLEARYNLGKLSKALHSEKQQNAYDRLNESIKNKLINFKISDKAVDGDGALEENNVDANPLPEENNQQNVIENN